KCPRSRFAARLRTPLGRPATSHPRSRARQRLRTTRPGTAKEGTGRPPRTGPRRLRVRTAPPRLIAPGHVPQSIAVSLAVRLVAFARVRLRLHSDESKRP